MQFALTLPLLLLLPLIGRAGLALARLATHDLRLARFLAPGIGLGLWLLAIHSFGLATHSFFTGLAAGTALVAGLGVASFLWTLPATAPSSLAPVRTPPGLWVGAAVMMLLFAGPQLRWQEHDETCFADHVAIPQQMENGIYPPRFPYFPQFEYRYHYGIDLATAALSELLSQADLSNTLHALSILLWGYTFCLWWLLGERWIGGPAAGAFAALGVMLAGGLNLMCLPRRPFSLFLMGDCSFAGSEILAPVISNFLQHPWALATPLSLCALLVFDGQRRNGWWYATLFALFAVLSLAEIICFAAMLGVIGVAGCFEGGRPRPRRVLEMAALVAGVVLTVTHLHGLFTADAEPARDYLALGSSFAPHSWRDWLLWQLGSFGATLPLGLLGVFCLRRQRWTMALLAAGAFAGANVFEDLTVSHKFSMVTQLALGFLSAAVLAKLWQRPRLRPVAAVAFCVHAAYALAWSYALTAAMPGIWFMRQVPPRPPPEDQAAIFYLQRHLQPGENIYRSQHADAYAFYGGLPEPFLDYQISSDHFSPSLLQSRSDLLSNPRLEPEPYLAQAFRWFVLGPEDDRVSANVARWTQNGRAELRAEFPPLKVFYLRR